jgi:hypothetical protein
MVDRSVFTTRTWGCGACGREKRHLSWSYDPPPECCNQAMHPPAGPARATFVIGDEIDEIHPHGVCWDDGTPRRFRSRTELRRVEREKGWVRVGETPNSTPNRWF